MARRRDTLFRDILYNFMNKIRETKLIVYMYHDFWVFHGEDEISHQYCVLKLSKC